MACPLVVGRPVPTVDTPMNKLELLETYSWPASMLRTRVFVGGVVPQQDYDFLYKAGVKGIYGPGTPIPASAKDVLEQIRKALAAK